MSYLVRESADGESDSRLLACLRIGATGLAHRLAREALLWGDLLMIRKQFLVLAECAEASARAE